MYRLLFEHHIPFEIVNEAGVQRGNLEDYKILVIPDVMSLADDTVEAIQSAVGNGLGLVATYMTGFVDGKGQQRQQPALADIFGIEFEDIIAHDTSAGITYDSALNVPDIDGSMFYYGSARTEHPLAQELPEKSLFSFQGSFVICRCSPESQIIADIHAIDQVRLSSRPYNRRGHYPGQPRWPLAIVREYGNARVAYFAPQAEAEWRRAHAPELDSLLVRSILWAGGPSPLETPDCPKSVEVRLFHSPKRQMFQILLVNLTTNSLVRVGGGPGVIRYVTPHKRLHLCLRIDKKVTNVQSQIGSEVHHRVNGNILEIELPLLKLYDSLLVEYRVGK
ncbi:beta-galactosidase trimerization domain-containing protein [bacterium]|nr:beta-galactosidase trimerization domain-containing protein [bacterium]